MSTEPFDHAPGTDLLVSSQRTLKIEEVDGRKVARFSLEPWMQGHTFAVDLSANASEGTPTGPFRIEYVLGTEFVIHESELPPFRFEEGYSHLTTSPEFDRLSVTLRYVDTTCPDVQKEATLRFGMSGHVLQKLIVETPEVDIEKAIRHTGQIVADLLDAISFLRRLPLSIRHIEVQAVGKKYNRRYMTFSYLPRQLTPDDLTQATTVPAGLKPAFRLFREGMNSTRPPYRLLCLYRVREVIGRVRRENDKEVLASRVTPERPTRVLPDNELTRCYFPTYVGKKVGAFLDHVRSAYRLAVAHGELDEGSRLVLDPAEVRIDHRIDFTNAALMPVIAEMIDDEIAFMERHGLNRK
jgi:hypothetical protein